MNISKGHDLSRQCHSHNVKRSSDDNEVWIERVHASSQNPRKLRQIWFSALDLDCIVLGPVRETPTHPDAVPLGWDRFSTIAEGTRVPIYALGGLAGNDLETAIAHGAHGIAMRRHAWPDAR